MEKLPAKDRILEAALTLFSEKGYDGVGVDLIAETAGLKGPSIYKHFKGKEEILEILLDRVESYYEANFGSSMQTGKIPDTMEELLKVSLQRIQFTIHDETVKKARRILTMEQFRKPKIAQLMTKYSIDGNQGLYQSIFSSMIEKGVIRKEDPAMLAMAFTSPVTLFIQMCDREPEREAEIMEKIEAYFDYFASEYELKQ